MSGPIPPVTLALGLGGLLPFWGLALLLTTRGAIGPDPALVDLALATYAALILSFLGGIRWGLALRSGANAAAYALSVVPQLVAWGLLLAPEPWRLGAFGVVLLALGPLDLQLVRDGSAPAWFGKLRLILSSGAGLACLAAAFALRTA